jgi:hypothetical protein
VVLVDDLVAAVAGDQPAVEGERGNEGDRERDGEAPPKSASPSPASMAPGTTRMTEFNDLL